MSQPCPPAEHELSHPPSQRSPPLYRRCNTEYQSRATPRPADPVARGSAITPGLGAPHGLGHHRLPVVRGTSRQPVPVKPEEPIPPKPPDHQPPAVPGIQQVKLGPPPHAPAEYPCKHEPLITEATYGGRTLHSALPSDRGCHRLGRALAQLINTPTKPNRQNEPRGDPVIRPYTHTYTQTRLTTHIYTHHTQTQTNKKTIKSTNKQTNDQANKQRSEQTTKQTEEQERKHTIKQTTKKQSNK
jgi:hypothetical protein